MLITAISLTLLSSSQGQPTDAAAPAQKPPPIVVKTIRTSPAIKLLSVAAAPTGGKVVVGAEDKSVRIIDPATGATLKSFTGHPQQCYAVAWSPNGKLIASGDESARIFVWDVASGKKLRELRGHIRGIQALSFNSNSTMLMSTGKDDTIRVYNLADGKLAKNILGKGANLYGGQYLSNGGTLVATLGEGVKLTRGNKTTTFNFPANQGYWDAAYIPQSDLVLTAARDGRVGVWGATTGIRVQLLLGHQDWVVHLAVTPNGRFAFSSSSDGTVRAWDMKTLTTVAKLGDTSYVGAPLAVTADGKYLISSSSSDSMQVSTLNPPQAGSATKSPGKSKKGKS